MCSLDFYISQLYSCFCFLVTAINMADVKNDQAIMHNNTKVKKVQNVAFADANEKAQPSLFTRRMFMVCMH